MLCSQAPVSSSAKRAVGESKLVQTESKKATTTSTTPKLTRFEGLPHFFVVRNVWMILKMRIFQLDFSDFQAPWPLHREQMAKSTGKSFMKSSRPLTSFRFHCPRLERSLNQRFSSFEGSYSHLMPYTCIYIHNYVYIYIGIVSLRAWVLSPFRSS